MRYLASEHEGYPLGRWESPPRQRVELHMLTGSKLKLLATSVAGTKSRMQY